MTESYMRIGDDDRTEATAMLSRALVSGHVDMVTYDQRQTAIAESVTRSDLDKIFSDIDIPLPWNKQLDFKIKASKARTILGGRYYWSSYVIGSLVILTIIGIIFGIVMSEGSLLAAAIFLAVAFLATIVIALGYSWLLEQKIRDAMDILSAGPTDEWHYVERWYM